MSIRFAFCLALVACSGPSRAAPDAVPADVPRSVAGIFRVTSSLELADVPELARPLLAELGSATDDPDDPGRYLVERTIDAMQDTEAKTIARELLPVLAGVVQAELSDIAPKLGPGLVAIARDFERDARQMQTHELWRIQLGGAIDRVITGVHFDDTDVAFADTQLPDATAASTVALHSTGALAISDHEVAWSYGSVLRLALDRAIIPKAVPGAHDLAQALALLVDCRRLGTRVAAAVGFGSDALYTAACTIALTEAADRFYARLPTGTVPLRMTGSARGVDRDADGNMDEITGGTWSGSLDAEGLAAATFEGEK